MHEMKALKLNIFRLIATFTLLAAFSFSLNLTAAPKASIVKPTPTELYLAHELEFKFDPEFTILEYLYGVVFAIESTPKKSPQDFLLLGDLYHWLGHVADDAEDFERAARYHRASMVAYKKSRIRKSARINNLNGPEHALYHIMRTRELSLTPSILRRVGRAQDVAYTNRSEIASVLFASKKTIRQQAAELSDLCEVILTARYSE